MENDISILQGAPVVRKGDYVVINLGEEKVKKMQNGHGGWEPDRRNYLGVKGKVKKIESDGDVVIKFAGAEYTFNPKVVAKVLDVGNYVKISNNREKARHLQIKHGEWEPNMENCLDKVAKVVEVCENYDVKVRTTFDQVHRLNPLLCTVVKFPSDDHPDEFIRLSKEFEIKKDGKIFNLMNSTKIRASSCSDLFIRIFNDDEEKIIELLENGADINQTDKDGDTGLHKAVKKNFPHIVKLLLSKDARADILNKKKLAPIHIALHLGYMECLKELLDSSINIEDADDGDTLLGQAITKKKYDVIDLLIGHPKLKIPKRNYKGFTAFHIAVGKGYNGVVKKIVQRKPTSVKIKTTFGLTALHIAAFYDILGVANILIEAGAELDSEAKGGLTPLMLAANRNNLDLVKLLVDNGTDINAQDKNEDASIHLAVKSKSQPTSLFEMVFPKVSAKDRDDVIRYLVDNGANLDIRNKRGETPLDLIDDENLKMEIQEKARIRKEKCCHMCSKMKYYVKFQPCGHSRLCVLCDEINNQIEGCPKCGVKIKKRIQPKEGNINVINLERFFKAGDKVCIKQDIQNNGIELQDKIGHVGHTKQTGKLEVLFDRKSYFLQPEMLTKVFSCEDQVRLHRNIELVKDLQENHGIWTEDIKKIIHKVGTVKKVVQPLIHVKFGNIICQIHPIACINLRRTVPVTNGDAHDATYCLKCAKNTTEMFPLQCGHAYCSKCKYLGKCTSC